ncbi:hypothetical protein [Photobacterium halotolerans]|uniref:Uncharacterized protein n=1 Tax=Photobacterium halotolerans TaxID=265726 RepID=A0A0F5VFQ1_9GAMM|nr:hypothetical protein [Photobacterium halotolerans]KKD00954.1 hypothetical protein KY46_03980 [Photobacterium halotolerans]
MSEIWQDTCVGILLCCAVSLSPVLDRSVSPEGLFQVTQVVQTQEEDVWIQLFDTTALARLSESDSLEQTGPPLCPRADAGTQCLGNASGQQELCQRALLEEMGVRNTFF